MKLPTCTVPTHQAWEKLRQKTGGKSGLSKVNMGKTLDAFHAALAKSTTSNDLAPTTHAIGTLGKVAHSYLEDIKKLKKFVELESVVSREIIGKLNAFAKGLEQAAKNANAELNRVEHEIRNRIDMVQRTTTECDKRVNPMNEEFKGMAAKYKYGVPKKDSPNLTKMVKEGADLLAGYKKAIAQLDKELLEVVTENARDHRPIIEKVNSELGKAKGQIKKSNEAITLGLNRTKELTIYLKKLVG
jgi:peptidoglycan hydrolase CwlO-like protein